MAVTSPQNKSMTVNLEAQVDRHVLEENLELHFASLEVCKGSHEHLFFFTWLETFLPALEV